MNEGETVNLVSGFSDAGIGDTHTYLWEVAADNGQVIQPGSAANFSFVPTDEGIYTVSMTVTDDDGDSASDQMMIAVMNEAPSSVMIQNLPSLAVEGSEISNLHVVFTGPIVDTFDFRWEVIIPEGQPHITGTENLPDFTFMPRNDGLYTVKVTVKDDDGSTAFGQAEINVENEAPGLQSPFNDMTINEGENVMVQGAFTDPGSDSLQAKVDYGDGTVESLFLGVDNVFQTNHTYTHDGVYNLSLYVSDGVEETTEQIDVTVQNIVPAINGSFDDGTTITAKLEGEIVFFIGTVDYQGAGQPQVRVDFGDGIILPVQLQTDDTFAISHIYADDNIDPYVVSFIVYDPDGDSDEETLSVNIQNANPILNIAGPDALQAGETFELDLYSIDLGDDTTTGWTIDWGDGTPTQNVEGNANSVTHVYDTPTIYLGDFDNDGDVDDEDLAVFSAHFGLIGWDDAYTISATASDEDGTYSANTLNVAIVEAAQEQKESPTSNQGAGRDDASSPMMAAAVPESEPVRHNRAKTKPRLEHGPWRRLLSPFGKSMSEQSPWKVELDDWNVRTVSFHTKIGPLRANTRLLLAFRGCNRSIPVS